MTKPDPFCIFCSLGRQRPCAPNGIFDASWLVFSYLEMINADEKEREIHEPLSWAHSCLSEILNTDPEHAFEITLLMIDALTSRFQASVVAAGPLEDLIANYGQQFVDRIEALWSKSQRFQFVLSGVWPQGQEDYEVWKRISRLKETGLHMDRGDDLPPADVKL